MSQEMCPQCDSLQNMTESKTTMEKEDDQGNVIITVFTAYHCEECLSFVYSETEEMSEEDMNFNMDYYNPL